MCHWSPRKNNLILHWCWRRTFHQRARLIHQKGGSAELLIIYSGLKMGCPLYNINTSSGILFLLRNDLTDLYSVSAMFCIKKFKFYLYSDNLYSDNFKSDHKITQNQGLKWAIIFWPGAVQLQPLLNWQYHYHWQPRHVMYIVKCKFGQLHTQRKLYHSNQPFNIM